ncbi:hypothetical protein [Acuticoccus sediminis]|uniref:hypothetical protein n=1 Tax=Acuticoccus sediminis TaxID=2184697 RepID=UPI001CFDBC08|nr:hypothetical protein [Acuticoccus sediminis]
MLSAKRPSRTVKETLMAEVRDAPAGAKKRLNAEVEAVLYKRIKSQAVAEERTISEITRQLWIEYLSNCSTG